MRAVVTIARYEIVMMWRRRSLVLLVGLLLTGMIGFALLIENSTGSQGDFIPTEDSVELPVWAQNIDFVVVGNTFKLSNLMIAVMVIFGCGILLMMGEVIPLDHQFRIRELLDTVPISRSAYLLGKLLGVTGGVFAAWLIAGVVGGVVLRGVFGEYDVRVYLLLWTLLVLITSLLIAEISVVTGSWVSSRRASVLIGLVMLPFGLFLMILAVPSMAGSGALIEPIYALSILLTPDELGRAEISGRITQILGTFVLIAVTLWVLGWGWMRLRDLR